MNSDAPADIRTNSNTTTAFGLTSRLIALFLVFQLAIGTDAGGSREKAIAQKAASFSLLDQTGRRVTEEQFVGKPSVIFFGFTNCPDICPTTLYDITQSLQKLGPDADKLNVIFVSVDPERDTTSVLRSYLSNFDSRIVGLTGDTATVAALAKSLGATFKKVPTGGGDYVLEHSIVHFLVDREWRKSGVIYVRPSDDGRKHAVKKLRDLIRQR